MRRVRMMFVFLVVSALWCGTALADLEPHIPSLSADQVERLNAGEIIAEIVESETPEGDVLGIIDAPPLEVMQVIQQFDRHHEFMEDIEESEVVSIDGDVYHLRGLTDTPWPMEDRYWELLATGGEAQVDGVDVYLSTYQYVEGSGNIDDSQGFWLMIPWGDDGSQTLLRYRIRVDLGTWLPDFVLEWATENFLPVRIQGVRDMIAAGIGG